MTSDFERQPLRLRPQDLEDKVAVVTGASKGIGRAIAINLLCRGCNVIITFSSPESAFLVEKLRLDINELHIVDDTHQLRTPPKVIGVQSDITSPDCPTTIADKIDQEFGGKLNILVNNAAVTGGCRIGQTSAEFVQRKLQANVQTPIMLVDELVKRKMFAPESRIVNISSDRARRTSADSLVYSASKSALESLARTWAHVLGGNNDEYSFMAGTTANSVSVGATESEAASRISAEQRQQRMATELANQVIAPNGQAHFGQCEDIADVVGVLCSKETRWITGSVVPANGGASMIL